MTYQQYGAIVQITMEDIEIKYSMNLRSNSYNPGLTNLYIKNDANGIDVIKPASITVPHFILNHLSGEYTVNSAISKSNDEIHDAKISSINIDATIEAKRKDINQFLVNLNASLKCAETSSNRSDVATFMVIREVTGRWL